MALRMMSALMSSAQESPEENSTENHDTVKYKLQQELLFAAKQCHKRFGGKAELATESDACVTQLLHTFEQIFSHGLKNIRHERINSALRHVSDLVKSTNKSSDGFWPCVREQLTWHEQERFCVLKKVQTDQGRGRAWLRAALNERSLERHLHSLIDPVGVEPFYENWAFLLDQDKSSLLPNVAAGLTTILFALRLDNEELDSLKENNSLSSKNAISEPIITSEIPESSISAFKTRKKVTTHVISFDDDDDDDEIDIQPVNHLASASAPTTCLNSPSTGLVLDTASVSSSTKMQSLVESNEIVLDVKPINWDEKYNESCSSSTDELNKQYKENCEEERLLTPVDDTENIKGLVPVSPLDGTLDDVLASLPSYLDDSEVTEPAVEAIEPFVDSQDTTEALDAKNLRLRLSALNELLEQAREDAISSKSQLARLQRQHQNYLEKHELQIQTLNRENELLRQQLRKYVTAVQMLKKDANHVDEEAPDYHRESQEYQSKLVQVAEMHAELMEFNARLTMQLTKKDKLVKLLQAELECLRGPINEEDVPLEAPCLIHVWIPSAFLTGKPSDIHHVYQIYIRIRDIEWNIYRRYAQFHALYKELKKHDTIVTSFEFPPKRTIGNKDAKFVEERRQKLQQWLRQIVNRFSHCSPAFSLNPCKQTLITLMPFFGDIQNNGEVQRNNAARNAYSSSPQYMGL